MKWEEKFSSIFPHPPESPRINVLYLSSYMIIFHQPSASQNWIMMKVIFQHSFEKCISCIRSHHSFDVKKCGSCLKITHKVIIPPQSWSWRYPVLYKYLLIGLRMCQIFRRRSLKVPYHQPVWLITKKRNYHICTDDSQTWKSQPFYGFFYYCYYLNYSTFIYTEF